ncbi:MAG: Flp pilus assembly complex ATPase component TadA [Gammaproteobacteria bacterium]|nr:Flp pilus assembly complex ATPase component TadA [Gammaproteobacteria bacterium]
MQTSSFAQFLVTKGLLTNTQLTDAITKADADKRSLINYFQQTNIIDQTQLADSIAEYFAIKRINLTELNPDTLPLESINKQLITSHNILPINQSDNNLVIAISDPTQTQTINEIKFHSNCNITLTIAAHDKLQEFITKALHKQQYNELNSDDSEIIKLVDHIISDAINKQASDIHFEPYEHYYRVRFRIDGMLHEIIKPDNKLASRVSSRLKIISNLDISERRLPQDGRFSITINSQTRDCRINTCPTLFGEKIVIRLLTPNNTSLKLNELGLNEQQLATIEKAIAQPQGMLLVTGPTGSGKTISLYAALNALNTIDKNISTAEDPIEINLAGINQVAINQKINLTFATTLRAFLRQDPDIIMLGEIRDQETAEIAIKAAQTGHLVLSTLHTNSCAATITRLMNMNIANYNITSSLSLIIAQRLARKLCPHCRQIDATHNEPELTGATIYRAHGCEHCNKGYKDRVGIFEVMPVTSNIQELILSNKSILEIEQQATIDGMITLRQSAFNLVRQGITSLAEINRTTT